METIQASDFQKLDIRIGTVLEARDFPEARNPALRLKVDFGPDGIRQSSAQITDHYRAQDLVGRQVVGLINLPVRRIAHFSSECLILGVYDAAGKVVLLQPDRPVDNGCKIG